MSWDGIRDKIVTVLAGITNIGNVYTYMPLAYTEEDMASLFLYASTDDIRVWTVTRVATRDVRNPNERIPLGQSIRRHTYAIEGYMAYQDSGSSTDEFQNLVDLVVETFAPQITLGGSAEVTYGMDARMDLKPISSYLCHHVAIEVTADERKNRSFS